VVDVVAWVVPPVAVVDVVAWVVPPELWVLLLLS
jgi:hypothetical protein